MLDLGLAIAHHLLVFAIAAFLAAELALVRVPLSGATLRRITAIDAAYGIAAVLVLIVGFGRVFSGPKGADYFLGNAWFWAKIGALVAVGLLSILPTMRFIAWRRLAEATPGTPIADAEVVSVRRFILAEAIVFPAIPLFAAAMARYG